MLIKELQALRRKFDWKVLRRGRRFAEPSALPRRVSLVLVSHGDELAQTQIYPFYLYRRRLAEELGLEFAELEDRWLAGADDERSDTTPVATRPDVEWVLFQTWFDLGEPALLARVRRLRRTFPNAKLVYLDFFAPLDLRFARSLDPYIHKYVKKQVFRDFDRYSRPTLGDTNLTDFFARRYGLQMPVVDHGVPRDFGSKLHVGENFCWAPYMIDRFLSELPLGERPIDVHARIAVQGEEWYAMMRREALLAALGTPELAVAAEGRVHRRAFLRELAASKVCFSPFGYGEVCWRDFEAIFSGALLVKPRVEHLTTAPDLFVEGETYVAVEMDLSDYADTVRWWVSRERRRKEVVHNAFERVCGHLRADAFVGSLASLLDLEGRSANGRTVMQ